MISKERTYIKILYAVPWTSESISWNPCFIQGHQSACPSGLCFIQFTSGQLKDTRSSKSRDLTCQQMWNMHDLISSTEVSRVSLLFISCSKNNIHASLHLWCAWKFIRKDLCDAYCWIEMDEWICYWHGLKMTLERDKTEMFCMQIFRKRT